MIRRILKVGEKSEDIELLEVDNRTGRAVVKIGDEEKLLVLDDSPVEEFGRTLHFKSASSDQVLEIYQELSGRTVLRANNLPGNKFSLKTTNLSTEDALALLEEAFLAKAVVLQQRGPKFTLAVRANDVSRLSFIPDPPAPAANAGDDSEKFPPGMMVFTDADLLQVLEIYEQLAQRTIIRPSNLIGKVTLRTQTELTRREAIWMLDAALGLGNIAMIPHGDKFVYVLPGIENPQLSIFTPSYVPASVQSKEFLPAGYLNFRGANLTQVLNTYAKLIDREASPHHSTAPAVMLNLRSVTPLTASEATFALDALAAVNHLKFDLVGDRQVQVSPVAKARPEARRSAQQLQLKE